MNTPGNSSIVKWGSYDINAIDTKSELVMLRTVGASWTLSASEIYLNGNNTLTNITKQIHMMPHLPFMYIPDADWTHVAYTLNNLYPANSHIPLDCDYSSNYCRFSTTCNYINQSDLPVSILLQDETGAQFNLTTI